MKNEQAPYAKVLSALGLCRKAGKLVCGTPLVCETLGGRNKPQMVLSACDNASNTHKKLTDKCGFYGVEMIMLPFDGEQLAAAVGKTARISSVAVTDENLSRLVRGALQKE